VTIVLIGAVWLASSVVMLAVCRIASLADERIQSEAGTSGGADWRALHPASAGSKPRIEPDLARMTPAATAAEL
jgi:hypothetical protein